MRTKMICWVAMLSVGCTANVADEGDEPPVVESALSPGASLEEAGEYMSTEDELKGDDATEAGGGALGACKIIKRNPSALVLTKSAVTLWELDMQKGERYGVLVSRGQPFGSAGVHVTLEKKAGDGWQQVQEWKATLPKRARGYQDIGDAGRYRFRGWVNSGMMNVRIALDQISTGCGTPAACFGASGDECGFCREGSDGTFSCAVSIGSVAHDTCCGRASEPCTVTFTGPCVEQWRRAVGDQWDQANKMPNVETYDFDPALPGYNGQLLGTLHAPGSDPMRLKNNRLQTLALQKGKYAWPNEQAWCAVGTAHANQDGKRIICD